MEPIFVKDFHISDAYVDCNGRLKPSMLLYFAQEVAGLHFTDLAMDYETLANRRMFWAVTRHKVQVERLPHRGETIRVETWPMPTTRVAYPRSIVAYDAAGNLLFRSVSLWVLMDLDSRNMILPGRSGISVDGTLRGLELASPMGIAAKPLNNSHCRTVCFTDLDRNGHMNNTRYLDWIDDLLSGEFHREHVIRDFAVCYLSETREGQVLTFRWDFLEDGGLQVDAYRQAEEKEERVFAARLLFDREM